MKKDLKIVAKILIKKDGSEGFGNIQSNHLLISYELPQLFLETATIEDISKILTDSKDKESLIKRWKLKTIKIKL